MLDIDPAKVVRKGRLQPGRMFLVDTAQGRIVDDAEIKAEPGRRAPLRPVAGRRSGGSRGSAAAADAHPPARVGGDPSAAVRLHQRGAAAHRGPHGPGRGRSRVGSMGNDAALAALSDRPRLLYDYFTQLFAQVTNPPLDAIREELVTSCRSRLGPETQPARPHAGVVPADHPALPGDRQRRPGQVALRQRARGDAGIQGLRHRRALRRHRRGRRRCTTPSRRSAAGSASPSPWAPTSSSCPTATPTPPWPPSRRCFSRRPSTSIWCGRRRGPGWVWWSRRATPVRCTTWRSSSASGPRPSIPIWPSRRSTT